MSDWLHWSTASRGALYGPDGFYRRAAGPAASFRTSVQSGSVYARAVSTLLCEVDAALGSPDPLEVVDVGAGHGDLLVALHGFLPRPLTRRVRLIAVEIADRPGALPSGIAWRHELPDSVTGLVLANEWLDNVPLDIAVSTGDGARLVQVDPCTGQERLDGPPPPDDAAWLAAWWPIAGAPRGARAEIGRPRDEAWAAAVSALRRGLAVAVDYAHERAARESGEYSAGTLMGYARGRAVPPVPDGSCDLTAHVALDACAAAGERAGATATLLSTQRAALRALGIQATLPPHALARRDPQAYLSALVDAGAAGELLASDGLGDFGWLVQGVGMALPPSLAPLSREPD